jgi:hypothetical protein
MNYNLPDSFHLFNNDSTDSVEGSSELDDLEEIDVCTRLFENELEEQTNELDEVVVNFEIDIGAAETSTSEYASDIPIEDSSSIEIEAYSSGDEKPDTIGV